MNAYILKRFTVIALSITAICTGAAAIALPTPAFAQKDGHPIVVAMGDSYSSGEGVEKFIDQDWSDKYTSDNWLAHRSTRAWPCLLKVNGSPLVKGESLFFVASSGAETQHLSTNKQHKGWNEWNSLAQPSGGKDLELQIDVFERDHLKGLVDYVTLTIGGNDLGFTKIVEAGVKNNTPFEAEEGTFEKVADTAIKSFDTMRKEGAFLTVYKEIAEAAGPQAHVIVAGYPHLFSNGKHEVYTTSNFHTGMVNLGIHWEEVEVINELVDTFDKGIQEDIESARDDAISFVDVRDSFRGSEDSLINPMWLFPKDEDLDQSESNISNQFKNVSAYSVHPNANGHIKYAEAVNAEIQRIEREKPAPEFEGSFDLIGTWDTTDGGISLTFERDGTYTCTCFGIPGEGTWAAQDDGAESFAIDLQGESFLSLMGLIYGSVLDDYHFEVLKCNNDNYYLVQVSGDETARSSPCKLGLTRKGCAPSFT